MAANGNEKMILEGFFTELSKSPNVKNRIVAHDRTIVEQNAENEFIFRLKRGTVRFEKRIFDDFGNVKNATVLGKMNSGDSWTCFCELSALGVQLRTSAAVVVESAEADVEVIPFEAYMKVVSKMPVSEIVFVKRLCIKLANMLKGLHMRDLKLGSLGAPTSLPGLRIRNEVVVYTWSAQMKSGLSKTSGYLCLSKNNVAFVKGKLGDKRGKSVDAADGKSHIFPLKRLSEVMLTKGKLSLSTPEQSQSVTIDDPAGPEAVREFLNLARKSIQSVSVASLTGGREYGGLSLCRLCNEVYCANCRSISILKNRCAAGSAHEYEERRVSPRTRFCGRCGNEGTHIISPKDLAMLRNACKVESVAPGEVFLHCNKKLTHMFYVLEGSCVAKLTVEGKEITLPPVDAGECVGEISFLLNSVPTADVEAGMAGCMVICIPTDFFEKAMSSKNKEDSLFAARVIRSVLAIMWRRIMKQEREQMDSWKKAISSSALDMDAKFLSESLMRDTGKGIDKQSSWYTAI
mmetsp:Transcript_29048/g.81269  ORF Transcript_29048/g.81269 Transcript_29048/m.81269 type:complete len:518 (+) Transcript_29048:68-1621(+)